VEKRRSGHCWGLGGTLIAPYAAKRKNEATCCCVEKKKIWREKILNKRLWNIDGEISIRREKL
jgi:hypothetical protein